MKVFFAVAPRDRVELSIVWPEFDFREGRLPVVLITGGAGGIGKKLTRHFEPLGWELRRLDLRNDAEPGVISADLSRWGDGWISHFAGVDAVIHLAANGSPEATYASVERNNVDMTLNVFEAAVRSGVKRVIFVSTNWVVAGKRFESCALLPTDEVAPVNAYGNSKWMGERVAKSFAEKHDLSAICFRIGYCQGRRENQPGPHMGWGLWGQQMWLSDRDLCQAFEKAVLAPSTVGFAVLNLMSSVKGSRWDLRSAEELIGYVPLDRYDPIETPEIEAHTRELADDQRQLEALRAKISANRW